MQPATIRPPAQAFQGREPGPGGHGFLRSRAGALLICGIPGGTLKRKKNESQLPRVLEWEVYAAGRLASIEPMDATDEEQSEQMALYAEAGLASNTWLTLHFDTLWLVRPLVRLQIDDARAFQGNNPKVRKFTERLWAQLAETVGVSPQTPLAGSEEGAWGGRGAA